MPILKRSLLIAPIIALGASIAGPAQAQQDLFYLDRAQLSGAPDDGYTVWRPHLYERTRFYGFTALGFTLNPLRADTTCPDPAAVEDLDNPVQGQLIGYFIIGTEVANRLGFNVALPVSFYTWYGENPISPTGGEQFNAEDKVALHDLRADARVRLLESNNRKFRLGLGGAAFAAIGNSAGAVAGDNQPSAFVYGAFEYDFDDFFIAANLGPHFKPVDGISIGARPDYSVGIGDEIRYSVGGYIPMRNDKIRLGLELFGTTGLEEVNGNRTFLAERNTNLEWLLQGRLKLDKDGQWQTMGGIGTRLLTSGYGGPDLRVLLSLGYWFTIKDTKTSTPAPRYKIVPGAEDHEKDRDGDGYPDDIDKCPDIKEDKRPPFPTDGCPADADRDGDGIPDSQDACPEVPEDKDGVADSDGCPETDADSDGIPDGQDKCPTEKGSASKVAERNGCPSIRFDGDDEIQLLEPIQFETGKAIIKPESFHILDEVASLLKSRKDLRIGVHGHTDSVGSDASNLTLSKNRAASCVKYLVDHGIPNSRLESQGFGEGQPVDTNDTPAGRARNRRTEFKVLN